MHLLIHNSRSRLVVAVAATCLALITCPALSQDSGRSPEELKTALQQGGYVIYFRHGATTWMGIDDITWPREKQRLLSEEGIADSEHIGTAFTDLGIPVGDIYASPFPRCREMALIAFGRVEDRPELLGILSDAKGREERITFLRNQVSKPVTEDGNRILISHSSNIREVAGVSLGEGDAVVIEPKGGGEFTVLGKISPADW